MNVTEDIKEFIDQYGTKFIKGPFDIDGQKYDYKLEDKNGIDYCTFEQLKLWKIKVITNIKM